LRYSGGPDANPLRSIILPAHNEADLLEECVRDLVKAMRERGEAFEIVVVENGSTDATGRLAERIELDNAEVRVLRLAHADYGAAVAKGFAVAKGETVVHFDVDYVDIGFLDKGAAIIDSGEAGIVLGSKRAPGSTDRRPVTRRLLTAGFTFAMRLLLQLPVSDAHGMKVISRSGCAEAAGACRMTGALYDVELVLRASRAGVRIAELPVDVHELRPPRTPVWRRSIESALGLLRLWLLLRQERAPRR